MSDLTPLRLNDQVTAQLEKSLATEMAQALDRKVEAKAAAALAVAYAPTPEKAEELRQNLRGVFGNLRT